MTVRKPDWLDVMLAANRQRLILIMMLNGQLDCETGAELYAHTTDTDEVEADRVAAITNNFGPDSPTGHLGMMYFKLKGEIQL